MKTSEHSLWQTAERCALVRAQEREEGADGTKSVFAMHKSSRRLNGRRSEVIIKKQQRQPRIQIDGGTGEPKNTIDNKRIIRDIEESPECWNKRLEWRGVLQERGGRLCRVEEVTEDDRVIRCQKLR
jgi:hypothetical protein